MQMLTEPMSAPEAFEKWWQALPLRNGEITSDHIRQAWDAAIIFERDEARKMTDAERNDRIAAAYAIIDETLGDALGWMQKETLARRIVDELAKSK